MMNRFTTPTCVAAALLLTLRGGLPPLDATGIRQQEGTVYELRITGTTGARKRLAVPPFAVRTATPQIQEAAKTISAVLWDDLEFEGEFYLIPHAEEAKVPAADSIGTLPYDRWSELGADAVVLGSVTSAADGLSVTVQIIGIRGDLKGKQIFGKIYGGGGCSVANPRYCAHYISDDFHKSQGIDGVARTRIAFSSDRGSEVVPGRVSENHAQEIYIADYDGARATRLTVSRGVSISPAWSPDAHYLAYVSYGLNGAGFPDVFVQSLYEYNKLARPAAGNESSQNFMPAWSPDGSRLAFASSRDGHFEIYVVNRDGSNLRRLTNRTDNNLAPAWAPSGQQLAFVSDRAGGSNPQLFLIGADGTGLERMNCAAPHCDHPSWSAAANKIAYTCGSSAAGFDICLLDMGSRQVVKLTDGPGSNEQPTFAPNGRHILFNTTRWGKQQLAMVDLKGVVHSRRITNMGNNKFPAWSRTPQ